MTYLFNPPLKSYPVPIENQRPEFREVGVAMNTQSNPYFCLYGDGKLNF